MRKMIAIFIVSVLLMASCTSEPTNTLLPTDTPEPTDTPAPTNTPEPELVADDTQVSEKDGMTLVYVPAGEFQMGSDADEGLAACRELYEPFSDNECKRSWYEDEEPIHTVYTDAFWMDKTEVTNAQYQHCVDEGDCDPPEWTGSYTRDEYFGNPQYDEYPVIYVSWHDAQTYCEWADRRLPTEAEWEKAARGEESLTYPWGNNFDGDRLNFCDNNCSEFERADWANPNYDDGYADTAPVGSYPAGASPYGVLDMAGNVWEWVADWHGSDYYDYSPSDNPEGPSSGDYRVLRGGSWYDSGNYVRAADRSGGPPDLTSYYFGLRCVRSFP